MGYPKIKPHIVEYLMKHPGQTVWRNELLDFVKSKLNGHIPTEGAIPNAVKGLIDSGHPIDVVEANHAWRYMPNREEAKKDEKKPDRPLFELVHKARNGVMILEDEQGETLFVKEIDI